jgi:DNA-binding GntR family transcriptional regulator
VEEHRSLYEALEAHDKARAEQMALQHVENAYKHIMGKEA